MVPESANGRLCCEQATEAVDDSRELLELCRASLYLQTLVRGADFIAEDQFYSWLNKLSPSMLYCLNCIRHQVLLVTVSQLICQPPLPPPLPHDQPGGCHSSTRQ